MSAGGAVLDPADVEHGGAELDLIPAQVAQCGCPQAMVEAITGRPDARSIGLRLLLLDLA
jgi:hypothetical protein